MARHRRWRGSAEVRHSSHASVAHLANGAPALRARGGRRDRADALAGAASRGLAADIVAARRVAAAVNRTRRAGEPSAQAGELAAFDLLHEIFHLLVVKAAELVPDTSMTASTEAVEEVVGEPVLDDLLEAVAEEFPDVDDRPPPVRLEELLLVRVANENPAARPLRDLVDDTPLPAEPRTATMTALEAYQGDLTPIGPNGETLVELLRAPARAHPTSIAGQLRYVRDHWRGLLGADLDALLDRLLVTLDVIAEEERGLHLRFGGGGDGGGGGRGEAPDLSGLDAEPERFSSDSAWMPRLVLIAKSTHVWLDQLSRRYERDIRTLDAIPDEELDRLARWGITGLWLIGLWERSPASRSGSRPGAATRTRRRRRTRSTTTGSPTTWAARRPGRTCGDRAWARGVRLASDMVPNHMGIDSRWVIEHPEWFMSLPEPPYPGYTFGGDNLAEDDRVEIRLEDHYWDNSDAAVVFERRDRWIGRPALHLPRQRRHELPVERHRPARLQPGRGPGAGHPDDRRRRTAVPGDPLRCRDGAGQEARPAAVVPGPGRGRRRHPVAGRVRDDVPGRVRRRDADRVLARGRRPGRGRGARTRSSWPRRSGCSRATSSGPWACTASTTARSCTCSATRTTRATGGCSRRRSSSTPRSSSATSTS